MTEITEGQVRAALIDAAVKTERERCAKIVAAFRKDADKLITPIERDRDPVRAVIVDAVVDSCNDLIAAVLQIIAGEADDRPDPPRVQQ